MPSATRPLYQLCLKEPRTPHLKLKKRRRLFPFINAVQLGCPSPGERARWRKLLTSWDREAERDRMKGQSTSAPSCPVQKDTETASHGSAPPDCRASQSSCWNQLNRQARPLPPGASRCMSLQWTFYMVMHPSILASTTNHFMERNIIIVKLG